jgi:hypothetical protein
MIAYSRNEIFPATHISKSFNDIQEIAEWVEMKEIEQIIRDRKGSKKTYPLEEVLRENGIDYE